jgi:hypothetical protein
MVKLYLHIGQPKTGTSAIQALLNQNREILACQFKILYPNLQGDDFGIGNYFNHAPFFKVGVANNTLDSCLQILQKCKDYCIENQITELIISGEGFYEANWAPQLFHRITNEIFDDFQIILYLRRQDYWIESAWKQWGHKDTSFKSIQEYSQRRNMNWNHFLSRWLKFFDKSDFIIRPFEKETIGEDIVKDFMLLLGIEINNTLQNPSRIYKNVNSGFQPEVIELLNICNYLVKDIHDNKIFDVISSALSDKFKKKSPFVSYGLLSPKERYEIVQKYSDSNREIAKIFFGPEKDNLFSEPWPDPNENWESPNFLTVEKIVPIFMELFLYHQNKINNLESSIKEISKSKYQSKSKAESIQYHQISLQNITIDKLTFSALNIPQLVTHINLLNQISSLNALETGVEFMATGNDPYFVINDGLFSRNLRALKIDITVPAGTALKVFYKSIFFQSFKEANSIRKHIYAGRNTIVIILPKWRLSKSLRIDPGELEGRYIIHSIEVGL